MLILILSAPPLLLALLVGLLISIFQAVTQIQDQNITFVPKIVAVFGVIAFLGYWLLSQITRFAAMLLYSFPQYIH